MAGPPFGGALNASPPKSGKARSGKAAGMKEVKLSREEEAYLFYCSKYLSYCSFCNTRAPLGATLIHLCWDADDAKAKLDYDVGLFIILFSGGSGRPVSKGAVGTSQCLLSKKSDS